MPDSTYLFLDFDDTLSDAAEHAAQYVRELAGLLASDCGGGAEQWAAAIAPAWQESVRRYEAKFTGNPLAGYNAWLEEERARMTEAIFAAVGAPLPAREPLGEFAKRVMFDALTGCNAAFPGAEDVLRELFEQGVRTQMASSQESDYLFAALIGAGVESYTESKFGPDLVDCAKEGPEFYRLIFEACGIRPSQAIVLDDLPVCLDWAEEAGAKVVQARIKPGGPEPEFPVVLTCLADLPELVKKISRE
jgi:FMN phosphatase YigB (HAD superfamily)